MPTPKGFSSPTASSTRHGTPICCRVRATLSPPIPPPAMSTGGSAIESGAIEIGSPATLIWAHENGRVAARAQGLRQRKLRPQESASPESQFRRQIRIAELEHDLAMLDSPLPVHFRVAIHVPRDAEDRRPDIPLLHDGRDIARSLRRIVAGQRDLRVAD